MLTELGLRCIALDSKGYGETASHLMNEYDGYLAHETAQGSSDNLHDFGFKNHADAVAGISKQLGVDKIIIGGHDWGGAVVWRVAQWYPNLVTHVMSVCTPYFKVFDQYVSTEQLTKSGVPQFGYQLQFGSADGVVEKVVNNEAKLRKFLSGLYGGKPKSGKLFMDPRKGVDLDLVENDDIGMTPLLSEEVCQEFTISRALVD
jgi:pimeloyl-ACP methyl ester carboxylesterase